MKKLLGIVVLGLLLSVNTYANTPVQQFVFEKLYDEYSKCTVYYKFTGRGIERKKDVAELTEKENSFLNEMNNLSKESEKNMFFFAQKLKISNQDVQSNIKNIYTSFLDIAGRDYSKTEILNEKYYHICVSAIEDPESRMVYWDVEFQKTKKKIKPKKDRDLSNIKLECLSNKKDNELTHFYFHFTDLNTAKRYEFSPFNYDISTEIMDYKAKKIEIELTTRPEKYIAIDQKFLISRKTLNLKFYATSYSEWWDWWDCKILDDDFDIMDHLKLIQKNKMEKRLL